MEINYHKNSKVKITKPGIFNDLIGTIQSIKIHVDCGTGMGVWAFSENEIELVQAGFKDILTDQDKQELAEARKHVEPIVEKMVKRIYKKRESKPKEVKKQTRKYTKKPKL